jgi:methylated-DNA-[protein]-cysteine S-methyltransferase
VELALVVREKEIGMNPVRLRKTEIETPAGAIVLVSRGPALVGLVFEDHWKGMREDLTRRFGEITFEEDPDGGGAAGAALRRYLAGDLEALDALQVDTGGTPFQQSVWRALRRIPPGTTWSYARLAREVGNPSAVRAVAGANARNPVSVVVPCHRVIASDGKLAGYGGGLPRKRWLLAHEGAILA